MKTWNQDWITESWSLHYHVYKFLKSGGSVKVALQKWNPLRVEYFQNWLIENSGTV